MSKNTLFIFFIIFFFNCDSKSQVELFPEYEFRFLENLVSEEIIFSPFSIQIPKGFNKLNKRNLDILKNRIENDLDPYINKELMHGFSDSLNTAFIISVIKDNKLLNILDKNYRVYLNKNNEEVIKNQYSVNGIKAVQYQAKNSINNVSFTNIKIFLINGDFGNYLIDFVVLDKNFNNILYSIESSLSTLKRRK